MQAGDISPLPVLLEPFMLALILFLVEPSRVLNTTWAFTRGQEIYVEETQRHLMQTEGATKVTAYFDVTYLWRYYVQNVKGDKVEVLAQLEKVRVNNPTEAGARATELLKQMKSSDSIWLLTPTEEGWNCQAVKKGHHPPPFFLLLGHRHAVRATGWTQTWQQDVPSQGTLRCQLTVIPNLSTSTPDRLRVRSRATIDWQDSTRQTAVKPSSIPGMGEFDAQRSRWLYFEMFSDGDWKLEQSGQKVTMRHQLYCAYRSYERRPQFP
jgi:hypothetical protein